MLYPKLFRFEFNSLARRHGFIGRHDGNSRLICQLGRTIQRRTCANCLEEILKMRLMRRLGFTARLVPDEEVYEVRRPL